jgi:hypothetical protein
MTFASAAKLPGPPGLLPWLPDAVIDLQSEAGARPVRGTWRYHDVQIAEIDYVGVRSDLGPSGEPKRTYDVLPHAEPVEFDDSAVSGRSAPGYAETAREPAQPGLRRWRRPHAIRDGHDEYHRPRVGMPGVRPIRDPCE